MEIFTYTTAKGQSTFFKSEYDIAGDAGCDRVSVSEDQISFIAEARTTPCAFPILPARETNIRGYLLACRLHNGVRTTPITTVVGPLYHLVELSSMANAGVPFGAAERRAGQQADVAV